MSDYSKFIGPAALGGFALGLLLGWTIAGDRADERCKHAHTATVVTNIDAGKMCATTLNGCMTTLSQCMTAIRK